MGGGASDSDLVLPDVPDRRPFFAHIDVSPENSGRLKRTSATQEDVFNASKNTVIPGDARVTAGLHRMLIFNYCWMISYMKNQMGGAYMKPDVPIAQAEVCKLLRVSPETVAKMVNFEEGYRSQLHEEDAYACAEVVQAYWDHPDRAFVRNPGTRIGEYDASLNAIRGGI